MLCYDRHQCTLRGKKNLSRWMMQEGKNLMLPYLGPEVVLGVEWRAGWRRPIDGVALVRDDYHLGVGPRTLWLRYRLLE